MLCVCKRTVSLQSTCTKAVHVPALISFHYVDFNGVLLLSRDLCMYKMKEINHWVIFHAFVMVC